MRGLLAILWERHEVDEFEYYFAFVNVKTLGGRTRVKIGFICLDHAEPRLCRREYFLASAYEEFHNGTKSFLFDEGVDRSETIHFLQREFLEYHKSFVQQFYNV